VIQLIPRLRTLVRIRPQDFWGGIDGLASICCSHLDQNFLRGTLVVFTKRARTTVKILAYDGSGFSLSQRRFSNGRPRYRPRRVRSLTPSHPYRADTDV
jgi:hypothetical protein